MNQFLRRSAACLLIITAPAICSAQAPAKVGFIYFGPVGDVGWTYQHDLGRKELEKNLGSKIVVRTVPNTLEGADGDRVARELSADGTKMIFAVGFGYMKAVLQIASENPDKCYATSSAYMTGPNASGYNAKWHEGGYLAGIVAGKTTKSNSIGFVGAHPVPDVMWYLNGFVQGARSVNPKANVRAVFVGSWSDPPKETEPATALINGAHRVGRSQDHRASGGPFRERVVTDENARHIGDATGRALRKGKRAEGQGNHCCGNVPGHDSPIILAPNCDLLPTGVSRCIPWRDDGRDGCGQQPR